ncbi:MAG TPA: chemotaxis protein CheD [Thermoanaerobaculia bacterium]|nr:chemotaxis protein CheD [Thermoanaerobaculia bacterium]
MSSLQELLDRSGLVRGEPAATIVDGRPRVYVHAGQVYASSVSTEVVTILGSCVAICLYDWARGIGGLNHFMLPTESTTPSPRYVRHATDMLLEQLVAMGASRSRLVAKLFGGAAVLKMGEGAVDLGSRNVEAARARLAQERIPIAAECVGGDRGRKLSFITSDGSARIKQV